MKRKDVAFEESLSEDWSKDLDVVEVPIGKATISSLAFAVTLIGCLVGGRLLYLGVVEGNTYKARASANLNSVKRIAAPRGLILDRFGKIIADNRIVFRAFLDPKEFFKKKELQEPTLDAIRDVLGLNPDEVRASLSANGPRLDDYTLPLILSPDLTQNQLLSLKSLGLSTILIENGYIRTYPNGSAFSTVLGYTSLVGIEDMKKNTELTNEDFIGKMGLEASYDKELRGTSGKIIEFRNAKGEVLGREEKTEPKTSPSLRTTLDGELQKYFYERLQAKLKELDRTTGVGMAFNPKTGEVLAMVSLPSYDSNVFTESSRAEERKEILTSSIRPLFNRAVSGSYAPGSTIKPLVGVAALAEHVISPTRTIFSPGYLDIPNPYNPSKPSRYLDWQYQGDVDLSSAIAQSSDVYFYQVGGGWKDIKGLGISRLNNWWKKFGLGSITGIDLPGEKPGFLPTPEWKEKYMKTPWLLGDTFNISIGQGDLEVTPIQLLSYIGAIANGGKVYAPYLNASKESKVIADLSNLEFEFKEVQKGMRETITAGKGTARILNDLPFAVGGKTGSAQVENNAKENAFFVGYAPFDDPKIAVMVLIEHSRQGSLNAVPVAKEVLNWYYENRLQ